MQNGNVRFFIVGIFCLLAVISHATTLAASEPIFVRQIEDINGCISSQTTQSPFQLTKAT